MSGFGAMDIEVTDLKGPAERAKLPPRVDKATTRGGDAPVLQDHVATRADHKVWTNTLTTRRTVRAVFEVLE
jgi:hypothetical protein